MKAIACIPESKLRNVEAGSRRSEQMAYLALLSVVLECSVTELLGSLSGGDHVESSAAA